MQMVCCNSNDKAYQKKLNTLLSGVFFDFQFWYDLDLWNEQYESYAIEENGRFIANVCLYKSRILFRGRHYPAISVGAVATHPDYRGRGCARRLMEHVIRLYAGTPMYLSANETVLDFYPKFGFRRVYEKQPVCDCVLANARSVPGRRSRVLAVTDPEVRRYIYGRSQFSAAFDCLDTESVSLFHLHAGYLQQQLIELPELSTLVAARQDGTTLKLLGVFSGQAISFADLISQLPFSGVKKITFGFMPYWADLAYQMIDAPTDPWFVREVACDLGDVKFPELSVT